MSDFEDDKMTSTDPPEEAGYANDEDDGAGDDDTHIANGRDRNGNAEEEEEEEEAAPSRRRYDDDEEEDDEEEEEEDEGDDGGTSRARKRAKRRHKRAADYNPFIDVEAEVDEDDEEEDDDDEYDKEGGFVVDHGGEGEEEDDARRATMHARLERRERELDDQDLARIAEDVSQRYKRTATRYTGDMNEIPQRLLMPSVHDANLWQVRAKPGKERELVMSLMRKAIDREFTARPLQILSAFERDSLPGMIYVEARSARQVMEACNGLVGVYPSRGVNLVPIEEMASLLLIKKQDLTITPGTWVRIRRGKYQGDLAQVLDITENGEEVGLKFIPRIDLNPKDESSGDARKRKKAVGGTGTGLGASLRPPLRFFNYEEVIKVYGRKSVSKRNQVYVFQNDTYRDGFVEKDFRISALQLDDVNPTLDEITRFSRGQDGTEDAGTKIDLSVIAEASRKAAIAVLQPGDHVEVFEGEQAGVQGSVESVAPDVVTIRAEGLDLEGQKIDVPARSVRKRFKPGDHVKVMTGKNMDETGLVVSVMDNIVTFLSDMSMQEVSVFSKDLREAAEVGSSTNVVGNYELHDLVQLDLQTVGVIYKTERDSFRVLDQHGQTRLVQPHQISMRRDSMRAIATDSEGHELHVNDNVKEIEGEKRTGRVLHIHQSFFAFLHNREIAENGGIFVTRTRSLASLAPKSNAAKPGLGAADLTKMNPAMSGGAGGGMVGSFHTGRGPRDRLIGVTVAIVKGPNKGYAGTIKDTNGPIARVELNTNNKVLPVQKAWLMRRNPNGGLEPLESFRSPQGGNGFPMPSYPASRDPNRGARTPGWGGGGQTPRTQNPYSSGKTPAWNSDSRTPFGAGGKTPAWGQDSRTPFGAGGGGKTPAWSQDSRTPHGAGSATPGRPTGGWGGATPGRQTSAWGGATPGRTESSGWGGATPGRSAWGNSGSSSPYHGGAAAAPTPGYSGAATAPTPGYTGAPTPADPGGWGSYPGAPTPGAAPTPYASARTPAYGAAAATPGMHPPDARPDTNAVGEYVAPKLWLQELNMPSQGCVVQLEGTRGNAGYIRWFDGQKEGLRGVAVARNVKGDKGTALVGPLPDGDQFNPIEVPMEYVRPVPPTAVGDMVIALQDSSEPPHIRVNQGDVVEVMEADADIWTVTKAKQSFHELHRDRMCLFQES